MAHEPLQEPVLFLRVPIGLLHRAASRSDRAEGAARRVGAELVGLRVGMLEDFPGLEVEKFLVADVLQHQRLFPIANDDPITLANLQLGHAAPPASIKDMRQTPTASCLRSMPSSKRRRGRLGCCEKSE